MHAMGQKRDVITGVVYTQNEQHVVTAGGPDGPLGDSAIGSGLIYSAPNSNKSPIGHFDFISTVTSIDEAGLRFITSIELSFKKNYSKRSWISRLQPAFNAKHQDNAIYVAGVGYHQLDGGMWSRPLTLGVTAGTGCFIGTEGTAVVNRDSASGFDIYSFQLL